MKNINILKMQSGVNSLGQSTGNYRMNLNACAKTIGKTRRHAARRTLAWIFGVCLFTIAAQPTWALNIQEAGTTISLNGPSGSPALDEVLLHARLPSSPGFGAWQPLNNEENATPGTLAVEASARAMVTVTSRLANLRAGGANLFSFNMDPERYPDPVLWASNASASVSDAVFSGEEGDDFSRLGFFINGVGMFGTRDVTSAAPGPGPAFVFAGEPGFEYDTGGILAGADYRFSDAFILGAAVGYGVTKADIDNNAGDYDIQGYNFMVYTTYYQEQFYLDATVSVGWNDYDATRNIFITGLSAGVDLDGQAEADIDGWQYAFSLGGGYDLDVNGLTYGPYARLDYARTRIDEYQENVKQVSGSTSTDRPSSGVLLPSDVTAVGLAVDQQNITSMTTALGVQATYAWSTAVGVLTPQVLFEYIHEFDNYARRVQAKFIDNTEPLNVVPFTIDTDGPDRDFFNLGLGLSAAFAHGISAFVYYETPIDLDNVTSHNFTGGVRLEF